MKPPLEQALRCPVPGCRVIIRAWTGLQELEKFIQHYARSHKCHMTMEEALERRVQAERQGNIHHKGG